MEVTQQIQKCFKQKSCPNGQLNNFKVCTYKVAISITNL